MRTLFLAPLGLALLAAACGETTGERATTGAAGGAVTGAAVGGPVGAVVGGGVGAAGGAYRPEVDQKTDAVAQNATSTTNNNSSGATAQNRRARGAAASSGGASRDQVRQAQTALQKAGYYHGKVDGLNGPQTRAAVRDYQAKENLTPTGRLDRTTMQHLRNVASNSGSSSGSMGTSGTSGSSMPSSSPNAGSSPANSGPNAPNAAPSSSGSSAGDPQMDR